jgi:hypothetical protein
MVIAGANRPTRGSMRYFEHVRPVHLEAKGWQPVGYEVTTADQAVLLGLESPIPEVREVFVASRSAHGGRTQPRRLAWSSESSARSGALPVISTE